MNRRTTGGRRRSRSRSTPCALPGGTARGADAAGDVRRHYRDAIQDANSNPGLDLIHFNLPGGGVHTIRPTRQLPIITDSVQIDGTTQPG